MKIPSTVFIYFYFFAHPFYSVGQITSPPTRIRLTNPSFEGSPMQSAAPDGWRSIDFQGESAPDVHPNGFWGVTTKPFSGKTYLGLVARANKTWERIGQVLSSKLIQDSCYQFSIFLAQSPVYRSGMNNRDHFPQLSKMSEEFNFTIPIILRVWALDSKRNKNQLIGESPKIDHERWKKYTFRFTSEDFFNAILLEAYYADEIIVNGNILIDEASDIIPIPCSYDK